MQINIVGISLD